MDCQYNSVDDVNTVEVGRREVGKLVEAERMASSNAFFFRHVFACVDC